LAGLVSHLFPSATGMVQRAGNFGICAFIFVAAATTVRAENPVVVIEGGPDPTGHNYTWTVTNNHASPIVQIEFPHYRASLFTASKGWTTACTNLEGIGVKDPSGVCRAAIENSGAGVPTGRSATFDMQIAGGGAKRGSGEVVVRFADGLTTTVAGVSVPTAEPSGDRNLPLMGLGTVFFIFLIARAARRRRRAQAVQS